MSLMIVAVIAAVVILGVIIGSELFRDVASSRESATREFRVREDAERAIQRGEASEARDLDIVASIFDPLGLFH